MSEIPVGIIGVTGYTGEELLRLLVNHPSFKLTRAVSRSEAGKTLAELFPALAKTDMAGLTVSSADIDDLARSCQLVFLAVPHGTAAELAGRLIDQGVKVVDLSADFRLRDPHIYEKWYGLAHKRTDLLAEAVFGLPELYAAQAVGARLIANPGCYPTSAILGLLPALKHGLINADDIVIDAKSGVSGAGRKAAVATLFCEVFDSFKPYNLGKHRHTPEIEQELSVIAGKALTVSFNPHLVPMSRGILSTIYTRLAKSVSIEEILEIYVGQYEKCPWVRVLPLGKLPETRHVKGTMFCDIGLVVDPRTNRLIIASAIDNMCRGASGQALANANIMLGQSIEAGLKAVSLEP